MELQHGWQPCRACHLPGQELRVEGEWHLRANPGYWGARAPRVMVLGFSKGANQIAAASAGDFDGVAFAGMRQRLQRVLEALGIDLYGQTIDEALSAQGRTLGAASLIRCGLSILKDGKLQTSGTIMPKAARTPFTLGVMKACVSQHLDPLPPSVETVILLGTTDAYMESVKNLMRAQFGDYRDLNQVGFLAQGRKWVFAAHPSPANGEFKNWLEGPTDSASGRKRAMAQCALGVGAATSHQLPRGIALETPPTVPALVPRPVIVKLTNPSASRGAARSLARAEAIIEAQFDRIKAGNKKVAGFQTPLGRHLAIQRDVQSINVWTEDVEPTHHLANFQRYPAGRTRHSNLTAQAPRVANGKNDRLWKRKDTGQLEALPIWYAKA